MKITNIKIRRTSMEDKLKAYVTVTFEDCFVVHNVKVIQGTNGIFIAMPSRKTKQGQYKDIFYPTDAQFRLLLQEQILDIYAKVVEEDAATNYNSVENK